MIQRAGVVGEVGLEDVQPAVVVVISRRDSHPRLLASVLVVGDAGRDSGLLECPIPAVVEQQRGGGVAGDIDIGPAVIVIVQHQRRESVAGAGP